MGSGVGVIRVMVMSGVIGVMVGVVVGVVGVHGGGVGYSSGEQIG
jgi:hypothetical protein